MRNDTTIIDIYIDYKELKHINEVHDLLKALTCKRTSKRSG